MREKPRIPALPHPGYLLSWSLLKAMATGCRIIAADTGPVREVIRHGCNGHLVGFFDGAELSRQLLTVLADVTGGVAISKEARATAAAYDLQPGIKAYSRILDIPEALRVLPLAEDVDMKQ